jgi:threonine dehydrogenase-like Zn-dependent dehydrogenase
MCTRGLQSQCETTQQRRWRKGAALFGYTHLYGGVPGGQAEYVRVPFANYGPIAVPEGPPDDRFLFLSDVLPTAWQAVEYADVPPEGTVAVFGLGPVGQMCVRVALRRGAARVIGVDLVPERLELARRWGADTLDARDGDVPSRVRELTGGRGADSVVDAVGMEAAGGPVARLLQTLMVKPDVYSALRPAALSLRRGGTLSLSGVYVGLLPLVPIGEVFDRQFAVRMGQANVRRWTDELLPLLGDDDPLGTEDLTTHRLPLERAPRRLRALPAQARRCIKVVLTP